MPQSGRMFGDLSLCYLLIETDHIIPEELHLLLRIMDVAHTYFYNIRLYICRLKSGLIYLSKFELMGN